MAARYGLHGVARAVLYASDENYFSAHVAAPFFIRRRIYADYRYAKAIFRPRYRAPLRHGREQALVISSILHDNSMQ